MNKFPICIPDGLNLVLAQPFHVTKPADISRALSKQTTDHLGVDVVCGTPEQTWGQECVWPFPWPGMVYDAQVDSLYGSTQHAHSQIDTTDPETGVQYSLIYLHLSSVTKSKTPEDNQVIVYNQGDVIGRIGNNGFVSPSPTPDNPKAGSHLHLGIGIKKPQELNYTMDDPLYYFDINDPYRASQSLTETSPSGRLIDLANQMMATNPVQAKIIIAVANMLKAFNIN